MNKTFFMKENKISTATCNLRNACQKILIIFIYFLLDRVTSDIFKRIL